MLHALGEKSYQFGKFSASTGKKVCIGFIRRKSEWGKERDEG